MILIYFLLFFSRLTGKRESLSETLDNNTQFSGDMVLAIIAVIIWIIVDRAIYKFKPIKRNKID
jgi:hypothetical protein